ncbi:MAG: hypothetical protein IKY83_00860 [Proteobacteria bacterium]|nr:hypothetical protein [Pseudomonadota bacterium]
MKTIMPFAILVICSACSLTDIDHVVECTLEGETRLAPTDDGYCAIQICTDKAWVTVAENSCAHASCRKTDDKYVCGECRNNTADYQFEDNQCQKRICKNGRWTDYQPEDNSLFCGLCKNDETRFFQNPDGTCVKQQCENKQWTDLESCGSVSCAIDSDTDDKTDPHYICGTCLNNTVEYFLWGDICFRRICTNGEWDDMVEENNPNYCEKCKEGSATYHNQADICQKKICHDGEYQIDSSFTCAYSCTKDGCGECINGTQRCAGPSIETCVDGKYIEAVKCPTECIQTEEAFTCQQICNTEGEKKCHNSENIGIFSICEGQKRLEAICQDNVMCASETECGECRYGEVICENSTLKTCVEGKWQIEPCPNHYSCNLNQCGECQDGNESYADLPTLQCRKYICQNGTWLESSLCAGNVSCTHQTSGEIHCGTCTNYTITASQSDKELYTCLNGKILTTTPCKFFSNPFIELGVYMACKISGFQSKDDIKCYNQYKDGKLVGYSRDSDKPCANNASCQVVDAGKTQCGNCQELSTQCVGSTLQTCVNGIWASEFDRQCPDGCTDGACIENDP